MPRRQGVYLSVAIVGALAVFLSAFRPISRPLDSLIGVSLSQLGIVDPNGRSNWVILFVPTEASLQEGQLLEKYILASERLRKVSGVGRGMGLCFAGGRPSQKLAGEINGSLVIGRPAVRLPFNGNNPRALLVSDGIVSHVISEHLSTAPEMFIPELVASPRSSNRNGEIANSQGIPQDSITFKADGSNPVNCPLGGHATLRFQGEIRPDAANIELSQLTIRRVIPATAQARLELDTRRSPVLIVSVPIVQEGLNPLQVELADAQGVVNVVRGSVTGAPPLVMEPRFLELGCVRPGATASQHVTVDRPRNAAYRLESTCPEIVVEHMSESVIDESRSRDTYQVKVLALAELGLIRGELRIAVPSLQLPCVHVRGEIGGILEITPSALYFESGVVGEKKRFTLEVRHRDAASVSCAVDQVPSTVQILSTESGTIVGEFTYPDSIGLHSATLKVRDEATENSGTLIPIITVVLPSVTDDQISEQPSTGSKDL